MPLTDATSKLFITELAAFFEGGGLPDLTMLFDADAAGLPPPPPNNALSSWRVWLKSCSEAHLHTVLQHGESFLTPPTIARAFADLRRAEMAAPESLASLATIVVNRKRLKQVVDEMITSRRCILRVDGGRREGKSFTYEILKSYVAATQVGHVVLDADFPGHLAPRGIVERLLSQVPNASQVIASEADTSHTKWVEQLAETVVLRTTRDVGAHGSRASWIVLDRCNAASTPDMQLFLSHLINRIASDALNERPEQRPKVPRLVLIECAEALTQSVQPVLLEDKTAPIHRGDVQEFFEQRKVPADQLAGCVDAVMKVLELPPDALSKPERERAHREHQLARMQDRIRTLVEKVKEPHA